MMCLCTFSLCSKIWVPIQNYLFHWQLSTKSDKRQSMSYLYRITSRAFSEAEGVIEKFTIVFLKFHLYSSI